MPADVWPWRFGKAVRTITFRKVLPAADLIEDAKARLALRKVNESLLRASEDLRSFSFAASHDLQEPLRVITVYSQLLSTRYGAELQGQAAKPVETIGDGAVRLTQLLRVGIGAVETTMGSYAVSYVCTSHLPMGTFEHALEIVILEAPPAISSDGLYYRTSRVGR
jgi:light-regulated signal transduction histidine kinase (bacteriophytochrome)